MVSGGYSPVVVCGLLIAGGSLVAEHGLQGSQAPGLTGFHSCSTGSVVLEHRLSCPAAYGIFLDQVSNSCPLLGRWILNHWTIREIQASQS